MSDLLSNINLPGYVIFGVVGYFCGYLFREAGLVKIIAIILIVPTVLQFIITIDDMLWVTLPFLLGVILGKIGLTQLKRLFILAGDALHDFRGRFR